MWLARFGGVVAAFGFLFTLSGVFPRENDRGAMMTTLLASFVVGIASSVMRRRGGAKPLTAFLGSFGTAGILLGLLGWVMVMSRGVAPPSAFALTELMQVETAQLGFMADSARYARSIEELGPRYQASPSPYGDAGPSTKATADGFVATVSVARTQQTCAIYEGATPVTPAVEPGKGACTPEPRGLGWLIGLAIAAAGIGIGYMGAKRHARSAHNVVAGSPSPSQP